MMNTETRNLANNETEVATIQLERPEVKYCSNCQTELKVVDDVRHTKFGLELCEDCLYF